MKTTAIENFDIAALAAGEETRELVAIEGPAGSGPWHLPAMRIKGTEDGPTLVVFGAVHGNEYEGVEAIPEILRQVTATRLRGLLVAVPVCNVPAYDAGTRNSPVDGLNLARVFPGRADGSITQRIAYWLKEKIISRADFLIDLHSGGVADDIPTMIGYSHGNDHASRMSQAAAEVFGAPVMWGHPDLALGRSVSAATECGVPWLYTETRGGGRATSADVTCYITGVLNVMQHLDMIEGDPDVAGPIWRLLGDGDLDATISAPVGGFFRPSVSLLEKVESGQRLGAIHDLFGDEIAEIAADRDGIIIMLRRTPAVDTGDSLGFVTGLQPKD